MSQVVLFFPNPVREEIAARLHLNNYGAGSIAGNAKKLIRRNPIPACARLGPDGQAVLAGHITEEVFDMSCKRGMLCTLMAVLVTSVVVASPEIATAQSGYGLDYTQRAKVGAGNQDSYRSIRRARDTAEDSYHYSRDVNRIDPADAKAKSEELGQDISKAQKALAKARKEAGNDAEALSALKSIEKHLAAAAEQHKMLHEECCKDAVEGSVCMKHCSQILSELDKAQAEQGALIRSMETKMKSGGTSNKTPQRQ